MAAYFECSNCKTVTLIEATPPRCPVCGKGNGMILSRDDNEATPRPARPTTAHLDKK